MAESAHLPLSPTCSTQEASIMSEQDEVMKRRELKSSFQELRINYDEIKGKPISNKISSSSFFAGGHEWKINCYPRGSNRFDKGKYLSIFIELMSKSRSVKAIIEVFLIGKDGQPSYTEAERSNVHLFRWDELGFPQFISKTDLAKNYVRDGQITIMCGVIIVNDQSIQVPRSNIGEQLATLLDNADGTDVSFIIDSETFHAHRAVLAARSPVFKAELLGSMAEASKSSIILQDITPSTFRAMLRFIYTDIFPKEDDLGESPTEMIQHLLAAADRYALDRMKFMCARRLWDDVSVDNVASTLACAEMHCCLELKKNCIEFFAVDKNFKKAVLTPGFVQLVQQFPSIIYELREKTGAGPSATLYSSRVQA